MTHSTPPHSEPSPSRPDLFITRSFPLLADACDYAKSLPAIAASHENPCRVGYVDYGDEILWFVLPRGSNAPEDFILTNLFPCDLE